MSSMDNSVSNVELNSDASIEDIIGSIRSNGMIFLSAQPDNSYFHWQVELYMYQFSKHNIIDRCYALFGYSGSQPSEEGMRLKKMYPTIMFYKDERKDTTYIPTIRPHLYKKFFKEYPELGKNVFIHDSDIFIVRMPNFKRMLEDSQRRSFVSDTISYIGFNYIKECCKRYKDKYPDLPELDIFDQMCSIVGVSPDIVKSKEKQSGGAQYFYRDQTYEFWDEAEIINEKLYKFLVDYEKKHPIEKHIQKWTTDMWVCLWLYWKIGHDTIVDPDLDFSWATGTVKDYNAKTIFHLAGVTNETKKTLYKAHYNKISIFEAYNKDRGIFDHISETSATKPYTDVIKEYFNTRYAQIKGYLTDDEYFKTEEGIKSKLIKRDVFGKKIGVDDSVRPSFFDKRRFSVINCRKFRITCDENNCNFDGDYVLDLNTIVCKKPIWRSSNNKFLIFHNGSSWVVTYKTYESEIGENKGGISFNKCDEPYYNDWNKECLIEILCD